MERRYISEKKVKTMIKYVIELPPITKKNSQQILINRKTGRPFIMPSKKYKEYESAALYYLPKRAGMPLEGPLNIKVLFYMKTRRKTDLTNRILPNTVFGFLVSRL